jgi:predicted ester cyclase
MITMTASDVAKAVVRRNTEEVQGKGRFDVFEELFADSFVDVQKLYTYIRAAFPDFHAEIHWQLVDGDRVTTYKTYYGTREGSFLGIAPTHCTIHFESVDVMRVQDGKITNHWGVGNLLSLMQQIGGWTPQAEVQAGGFPRNSGQRTFWYGAVPRLLKRRGSFAFTKSALCR